jgi:hypothetical protein
MTTSWSSIAAPTYPANSSIRSTTYRWSASGHGTAEYYCELAAGGDPGITLEPSDVIINALPATKGILGALVAGEYGWGDNDTKGFNTVYVRLSDGSDPDGKSAGYVQIEGWSNIASP